MKKADHSPVNPVYQQPPAGYDEMCTGSGKVRQHWQYLMDSFDAMGPGELLQRQRKQRLAAFGLLAGLLVGVFVGVGGGGGTTTSSTSTMPTTTVPLTPACRISRDRSSGR